MFGSKSCLKPISVFNFEKNGVLLLSKSKQTLPLKETHILTKNGNCNKKLIFSEISNLTKVTINKIIR